MNKDNISEYEISCCKIFANSINIMCLTNVSFSRARLFI